MMTGKENHYDPYGRPGPEPEAFWSGLFVGLIASGLFAFAFWLLWVFGG